MLRFGVPIGLILTAPGLPEGKTLQELPITQIKMVFSKLKAMIRKAAARTYDQLWKAVGNVCKLLTEEECYNVFKSAGYETD